LNLEESFRRVTTNRSPFRFHLLTVFLFGLTLSAFLGANVAWCPGRTAKITTAPETQKTVRFEKRGFLCIYAERYEDLTAKRGSFDGMGIVINAVSAIVCAVLVAVGCALWLRGK
jgi:hypothetical protein